MIAPLTLVHTAAVHQNRFDRLGPIHAPGADLIHVTRPDWLERAQCGISDSLRNEVQSVIQGASGPVLCTCTTLGEIAEQAGAIRIDTPMMRAAAALAVPVALVYALESTREASKALLQRELNSARTAEQTVIMIDATDAWPLFQSGQNDGFARAIADRVRTAVLDQPDIGAVVLAQASMDGAAAYLEDLGPAVFVSPARALAAAFDAAKIGGAD